MAHRGRYDRHVFVCVNQRPEGHPRRSCAAAGLALHARLKALAAQGSEDGPRLRINRSLCLDVCEKGPAMVVYPENCWYGAVRDEDLEEILETHLRQGEVVERLRIPDSELRPDA